MPQPKTGPDSPVPSLQGPCDRSLKSEVMPIRDPVDYSMVHAAVHAVREG